MSTSQLSLTSVLGLVAALFVTHSAGAEVKAPGTFVPSRCSKEIQYRGGIPLVGISQVCTGSIVGVTKSAVEIRSTVGQAKHFVVVSQQPVDVSIAEALELGESAQQVRMTLQTYEGSQMVVYSMVDAFGGVQSMSVPFGEGLRAVAVEFETVYTTQGLSILL